MVGRAPKKAFGDDHPIAHFRTAARLASIVKSSDGLQSLFHASAKPKKVFVEYSCFTLYRRVGASIYLGISLPFLASLCVDYKRIEAEPGGRGGKFLGIEYLPCDGKDNAPSRGDQSTLYIQRRKDRPQK